MAEGRIGATPTRVIMLETLAGIVRRRHRNALLAPEDTPDVRVDTIYNQARRALIRTYAHTRRRALDEEEGDSPPNPGLAAVARGGACCGVGDGVARLRILFQRR